MYIDGQCQPYGWEYVWEREAVDRVMVEWPEGWRTTESYGAVPRRGELILRNYNTFRVVNVVWRAAMRPIVYTEPFNADR
jgi:hypothetical protein